MPFSAFVIPLCAGFCAQQYSLVRAAMRADVTAQLVMSAQVITGDVRVRNFGYLSSNSVLVDVFFLSVVDANERLD